MLVVGSPYPCTPSGPGAPTWSHLGSPHHMYRSTQPTTLVLAFGRDRVLKLHTYERCHRSPGVRPHHISRTRCPRSRTCTEGSGLSLVPDLHLLRPSQGAAFLCPAGYCCHRLATAVLRLAQLPLCRLWPLLAGCSCPWLAVACWYLATTGCYCLPMAGASPR